MAEGLDLAPKRRGARRLEASPPLRRRRIRLRLLGTRIGPGQYPRKPDKDRCHGYAENHCIKRHHDLPRKLSESILSGRPWVVDMDQSRKAQPRLATAR